MLPLSYYILLVGNLKAEANAAAAQMTLTAGTATHPLHCLQRGLRQTLLHSHETKDTFSKTTSVVSEHFSNDF